MRVTRRIPPAPLSHTFSLDALAYGSIRQHTAAYVSIRQHTAAYVSIRQHTAAYVSIRQHTSTSCHGMLEQSVLSPAHSTSVSRAFSLDALAYVSIGKHTAAYVTCPQHVRIECLMRALTFCRYADACRQHAPEAC
jgi:hypothetical protein